MWREGIPFWQPGDTLYGSDVDILFAGLAAISLIVTFLLFAMLLTFAIRYRRTNTVDRGHRTNKSWRWEIGWTTATLLAFLALFVWGAALYLHAFQIPDGTLPIYVVAQQWMWKVQHPSGQREINELHVPVGQPVRLTLASQDVIHSFFVPAFRIKRDVVPGRFQTMWFKAERPGVFQLMCAEFCGTDHARMIGRVIAMPSAEFHDWLSRTDASATLAEAGSRLFRSLGCSGCHVGQGTVRAPSLDGLYGRPVPLSDGSFVTADERYIRDSILRPRSEVVAGFAPLMPSFEGRVTEDQLVDLVAYIKSLAADAENAR